MEDVTLSVHAVRAGAREMDAREVRFHEVDRPRSFNALVAEHRSDVVRYAYSIFRDWDCAEDVTHRAFLALLRGGRDLQCTGTVRAFLFQAVRNRSLKVARRRKTHQRLERPARESLYGPPTSPDDLLANAELSDQLREALGALAPRRRQAFVLARLQGLSHREIAEQMDLSPQTVANHVSLALRDLREALGAAEAEDGDAE